MENEFWIKIKDFENYQVSNLGRIKSIDRWTYYNNKKMFVYGKILSPEISNCGYLRVTLYKNSKIYKKFSVHRLVAESFIPNLENKSTVNHKNGIKTDNKVENLEWMTKSENLKHSYEFGLSKQISGNNSRLHKVKIAAKPVIQIEKNTNKIINNFSSIKEASIITKCSISHIGQVCRNERKTCGGFIWKYSK